MSEGAREEEQAEGGDGPAGGGPASWGGTEWRAAASLRANGGRDVQKVIEGARREFRAAAGDLTSIRYRMLGVHASIPPSSQETSKCDLEGKMDVETEFRNVIACGIQDGLDPLIDDWLNAASYQPGRREALGNP